MVLVGALAFASFTSGSLSTSHTASTWRPWTSGFVPRAPSSTIKVYEADWGPGLLRTVKGAAAKLIGAGVLFDPEAALPDINGR